MTKKRFFASVLALFLLLSCAALPTPAYAEGEEAPSNGLELSKTVKANDDGTYTITMESYTTGTVISSTKTVPVDIVLVLDQSGSMAWDFNGNSTNNNANRRQYAMKQAVNSFIASVNEKYSTEADHRMAIVTFGSNASTLQGWTFVNAEGKTTLQGKISTLPDSPSGATNVAAGMRQAETLMGSGYNYTGTNTQRQKVVIVFTDGVPTTGTEFDTTVATNAIASSKRLKDGGATVYTIGIFNGVNPNELYGASGFDRNSNGTVGSDWSNFSVWMIGDIQSYDVPAGNRFLNYLSSNFPSATKIGIKEFSRTFFGIGYRGWQITKNFERTSSNYYLTATNSDSLNAIFQSIVQNIQTASIDLGKDTVVKDTVTKYFDLPANRSDIKVYTAAAKAGGSFEDRVLTDLTPSIEDNAVSVKGFDFNENFVSDKVKEDGTYGKKLIVEFTVTPKAEFIGGNDVPTNDWENTGVYDKDGTLVENFNNETTTPKVNVPIKDVTVTPQDKNVYLLNGVTLDELKNGATVKVGDVSLNLTENNYGLEAWQNQYVDITVEIKDEKGNVVSADLEDLTDDTTYTITVKVAPKTEGTNASGTPNPMIGKSGSDKANIYVYKPELTYKDSEVFYGDPVPTDFNTNNRTDTKWKHGETEADTSKMGAAPTLTVTYTPEADKTTGNKINSKDDIQVKATVKIGETDVTGNTTFAHTACAEGVTCGWNETNLDGDPAFLLHVKTASLTIKKEGNVGETEGFIFNVVKADDANTSFRVSVQGNGQVTITGLPLGTYTVTEDTDWSWRYKGGVSVSDSSVTLTKQSPTGYVEVTNAKKNDYLLDGNAYARNNSKLSAAGN